MLVSRRQFLAVSALGGAACATPSTIAPRPAPAAQWLRRTVHHVPWPVSRPLTVAHLTDLHLGWGASVSLLERAILQCALSQPDLTVLTGDYLIDSLQHLRQLEALLRQLPRPCLATLGNHDHRAGAAAVQAAFVGQRIFVLRNESRHLHLCRAGRGCAELTVVGVDDSCTRHHDVRSAMARLPGACRAIVLTHDPEVTGQVSRHGAHLVLAGHTHGGQVYVPLLSPLVGRMLRRHYLAGWYRVGRARLYVNVGVGCASFRRRIGTRAQPELAIFILEPEPGTHKEVARC